MAQGNPKNEYITQEYLNNQLDKRFSEQTQVILSAFDKRFVQIDLSLDKRLNKMEERLSRDINNVQTLIDGYVKAQESFRQEFEIMKAELKQVKKIIKDKLGLEINAI